MNPLLLDESLDVLIDYRGRTPKKLGTDFTTAGVPVASAIHVSDGVLDLSNPRFVSFETWRSWMSIPTLKGDVLLTSEAPLGRVAQVPSDDPLVLGQRLFGLRGKRGVLDNKFLYYALQTASVQADLLGRSTGTTVFGIRQSALRKVTIPAPSFAEQAAIAEVLGALDDKIAANQVVVAGAEALAVALASRVNQSVALSELVTHHKETVTPDSIGDPLVSHYSLPAFDAEHVPESVSPQLIKSGKFEIRQSSVLVSKLNPRFPRVWDIPVVGAIRGLASTEFLVLESRYASSTMLWAVLSQSDFRASLESQVAGTSGSHQRVRPADLLATHVGDTRSIRGEVRDAITSLGRCIAACRAESAGLANMRDTLLPHLMSGRLRVKDAEQVVGGVV